jgi:hypothetical protein
MARTGIRSAYQGSPNIVKEATEIKFHPDNINREERFKLSKAWNPSTSLLRNSNTYHKNPKKTQRRAWGKKSENRDTRLSNMVKG